jgi:hypothetical protein
MSAPNPGLPAGLSQEALLAVIYERVDNLSTNFDSHRTEMNTKFSTIDKKMDEKFEEQDKKLANVDRVINRGYGAYLIIVGFAGVLAYTFDLWGKVAAAFKGLNA